MNSYIFSSREKTIFWRTSRAEVVQNIEIEFWQSVQDVHSNKEIWDDLYHASDAWPSLSYEWFATALKYFQSDDRLWVGVVKMDKRPIPIVHLEIAKERMAS